VEQRAVTMSPTSGKVTITTGSSVITLYVCITNNQPDTKSNPNPSPTTKCQTPSLRVTVAPTTQGTGHRE